MSADHETRIATLEVMVVALTELSFAVLPIVLKHDERLSVEAAEVLRKILVSPTNPPSPILSHYITVLRDVLVSPIPPSVVESSLQPSIRLVDPLV